MKRLILFGISGLLLSAPIVANASVFTDIEDSDLAKIEQVIKVQKEKVNLCKTVIEKTNSDVAQLKVKHKKLADDSAKIKEEKTVYNEAIKNLKNSISAKKEEAEKLAKEKAEAQAKKEAEALAKQQAEAKKSEDSDKNNSATSGESTQPTSGAIAERILLRKQIESGNNYNCFTGNGYLGAYQFAPATWRAMCAKIGSDPNDFSPANQDACANEYAKKYGGWMGVPTSGGW